MAQCCLICNNKVGLTLRNAVNLFGDQPGSKDEATTSETARIYNSLQSSKKLSELVSDILDKTLDEGKVHSNLLCKKCFKSCSEYDLIYTRLIKLKTEIQDQFKQSLISHNLDYDNYEKSVIEKNRMPPSKKEPVTIGKKLVLPASKLQPIPPDLLLKVGKLPITKNNLILPQIKAATASTLNLKVTVGTSVLTQTIKTTTTTNASEKQVTNMDPNSIEMVLSSSEANADFSRVETSRRRSVSPTFHRALDLMNITTAAVVPHFNERGTDTDKNAGGSHISASKEVIRRPHKKRSHKSKSVAASGTAMETFVVKKKRVSKAKDRAKKRSHAAASFDEPQSRPAVVVKMSRKHADPATDKKKEPQDVKKEQQRQQQQQCTAKTAAAEDLSVLTDAADRVRFWDDMLHCDFKSMKYTESLKNSQFTKEQCETIQKSFQHLSRQFCRRLVTGESYMKTHECLECDYSISHECTSIDSTEYWTLGRNAPCINFIRPESTTMCLCNFTLFHSHDSQSKSKSKRKAETPAVPSHSLSTMPSLVEENRTVNLRCPKCKLLVSIRNRHKDVCDNLINFITADGPNCRKFFNFVNHHLDFAPKEYPNMSEFYHCRNYCCIVFHRCDKNVILRNSMVL